jgi:hypothetical protein
MSAGEIGAAVGSILGFVVKFTRDVLLIWACARYLGLG